MKSWKNSFLLLFQFICFGIFISVNAFAFAKPKSYALVIGITTYQDDIYNNLQYPASDALRFATFLQDPNGRNIPQGNIRLLINEEATLASIIRGMEWLKTVCKKRDTAFIFFAGHGALETLAFDNQGYLLAYNTPRYHYRGVAVPITSINDLANILSTKNKAQVVMVTDACHSGKLAGNFLEKKPLVAEALTQVLNNEVRLAACQPHELAKEGSSWGGGVFTYHLLNGLKGSADNNADGLVRYNELAGYLQREVQNDKELLWRNEKQSPAVDGPPNFLMARKTQVLPTSLVPTVTLEAPQDFLANFGVAKASPLDYFFTISKYFPFEGIVDMEEVKQRSAAEWGGTILEQYITYYDSAFAFNYDIKSWREKKDGINEVTFIDTIYYNSFFAINRDSILLLEKQLKTDKSIQLQFAEKWTDWLHQRGVSVIDAYLNGDISELEKRQYYSVGSRTYQQLVDMQYLLLRHIGSRHSLYNNLLLQHYYLSGLICRLNMPFSPNTDSLLKEAFAWQYKASSIDDKTGYINNELGNLHLSAQNLDSAYHYFSFAAELAPAWAVPWSNLIRYNIAIKNYPGAYLAADIADSLQPNLSYMLANKGLAYEGEGKLMEATDAYYASIRLNDVHFLPYDRLARIWLQQGKYELADHMFYEAEKRKESFAVNPEYYDVGVELGGFPRLPGIELMPPPAVICDSIFETEKRLALKLLFDAVFYNANQLSNQEKIQNIEEALRLDPNLPFANHRLASLYLATGDLKNAAHAYEIAIRNYVSFEAANAYFLNKYFGERNGSFFSDCLSFLTSFLQYEKDEDYYLLADVYERLEQWEKAVKVYEQLCANEKARDLHQAKLNFIRPFSQFEEGGIQSELDSYQGMRMVNTVEPQIAYLKLIQLYEKLEQFRKAEEVVEDQIRFQQHCGFARDSVIQELQQYGARQGVNAYWLLANRTPEAVAFDFYLRMTNRYPRDPYWFEKGGLTLHQRLGLSYGQMKHEIYNSFTEAIERFAYPWLPGEEPHERDSLFFEIPGTGEQIRIDFPVYNPLQVAISWLDSSWRLYKSNDAPLATNIALAELNAWHGNMDESFSCYRTAIAKNTGDTLLIRDAAILMFIDHRYSESFSLQKQLARQTILHETMIPALFQNALLDKNWQYGERAISLLNQKDSLQQLCRALWQSQILWIKGDSIMASKKLEESLLPFGSWSHAALDDDSEDEKVIPAAMYTLSRYSAMLGKDDLAMAYLDQSINTGFDCGQVLAFDPAWGNLRKTEAWQVLSAKCHPREYDLQIDLDGRSILRFFSKNVLAVPTKFPKLYPSHYK